MAACEVAVTPREDEGTQIGTTPRETVTRIGGPHADKRLSLLVITDNNVVTYPLPPSGRVQIGRASTCEVVLDDPQVSRVHAELLVGETLRLRDRGSVNGTYVREERLDRDAIIDLQLGEVVRIGPATLICQPRSLPTLPRRIWSHDYFEVRLDEECARAAREGTGFALARLRCSVATPPAVVRELLADQVRAGDVIGDYGGNEYELLILEPDIAQARVVVTRLTNGLAEHGVQVRFGLAGYPADGRAADSLFAAAHPDPSDTRVDAELGAVISSDRRMIDLYALADRVAHGTISVLILGETGTGKEVLAQRIHDRSQRAGKPYLKLNCAALSESLLESELFGHERGAFTGAVAAKPGLLETAHGGTVFLDELGEMPLTTQVKLLRVLEERVVMRVGGVRTMSIDVRFVAATNRDLESEIARGTFRQDLYYRLNGVTLVIPPLRERTSEIPQLVRVFLGQSAKALGLARPPEVSPEAMALLRGYSWPGNIRELRNVVERAVLLAAEGIVRPTHLPLDKIHATIAERPAPTVASQEPTHDRKATSVEEITPPPGEVGDNTALTMTGRRRRLDDNDDERRVILEALAACGGNQTKAAAKLGISRRTLINRLEEFGAVRPRKERP